MKYTGPERRVHRVFITRNSEYHCRADLCVGVRDRASGRWLPGHAALGRHIAGAVRHDDDGSIEFKASLPGVGERLCLDGEMLVTSPVVAVERPLRCVVPLYPVERSA